MAIELRGVSKTYADGTVALEGVDLAFEDGVLGLLGPNGAGKTTLLEILTLGLEPSAGGRRYFGVDDATPERRRIRGWLGYLAQEYQPIPSLSGLEYLIWCGEVRELPLRRRELHRRAWRLLEAVGLEAAAERPAGTYSGGMARRLGLAQALVHAPRLLVVDEPTAGLDPEERIRFRSIVTDLGDRIPVLLSTHIVEDVEATCPRLCVLAHGRILFDGTPGSLVHRYEGRLWGVAEAEERPGVGQRSAAGGRTLQVVLDEVRPGASAEALSPSLEEAYAAFLLERPTAAAPGTPS